MKQKSHVRPIVYVMISVFLIIGYAYLTSSLTINGSTLLKKVTWDVHFENVQVKDGSVTGEQVIDEPEIDTNKTTVSFHVNLKKPGDYYEFTVDAVNAGTIDAMINTYTEFDLTTDQLKYLETSVTYEDGEEIQEKQQLLAGDYAVYKIVVSFKEDLEAEDLPDSPDQLDLEFTVEYVQRDDTAIERLAETNSLYNVLRREAERENGLALKYTGEHQDSIDASRSIRNIYHWYAYNDNNKAADILENNNVLFAGFCWQMIRTTDTGGVKMIYNGLSNNGVCDNTGTGQQIGKSKFNTSATSFADVGYMYGNRYIISSDRPYYEIYSTNTTIGTFYYADSYSYDSVSGKYSLVNPVSMSKYDSSIVGKYTYFSPNLSSTGDYIYYVMYKNSGIAYYVILSDNNSLSSYNYTFTYGNSYVDNGNGTYTINSPSYVQRFEIANTSFLNNKYICVNASNDTCSDLMYAFNTSRIDYISVNHIDDTFKYSSNFTYDDVSGKYTLGNDSVTIWDYTSTNIDKIAARRYTCFNESGICDELYYMFYLTVYKSFITLTDGKNLQNLLDDMLYADNVNQTDSKVKAYIDNWYSNNLVNYSDYLEDTVFCYNRNLTISDSNFSQIDFYPNNGSLYCQNVTDRFSISNNKAKLIYPIGLINYEELTLQKNSTLYKTGENYWLGSPRFISHGANVYHVSENGSLASILPVSSNYGVRPAISLKPGILFSSGDGSTSSPYVIDTN